MSTNDRVVKYSISGHAAHITMNRPTVMNALSKDMFRDLRRALQLAEANDKVQFISITGEGRAFSAGLDIVQVMGFKTPRDARDFVYKLVKPFWDTFLQTEKVIIANVNGPAYGAGAEIALFSDIVIASTNASFAFSGGRVGALCCISGVLGHVTMNGRKIMEMNLTGHPLTAEEAYRLGMINKVVQPSESSALMDELQQDLMRTSPTSNSSFKRIQKSVIPKTAYATAYHELYKTLTSPNFRIGAQAFARKSPAQYYQ